MLLLILSDVYIDQDIEFNRKCSQMKIWIRKLEGILSIIKKVIKINLLMDRKHIQAYH